MRAITPHNTIMMYTETNKGGFMKIENIDFTLLNNLSTFVFKPLIVLGMGALTVLLTTAMLA